MSRATKLICKLKHSFEFLKILEQASPDTVIRTITHAKPILVFWVTPEGKVLDAGSAHFQNPPAGDRTVLADATNKGHLRGRAAFIGKVLYVVVYGDSNSQVSNKQLSLLRRTYNKILAEIVSKGVSEEVAANAQFICEDGTDIIL